MATAGAVPEELWGWARAGAEMTAELSRAAREVATTLEAVRQRCPGVPAAVKPVGGQLAALARQGAELDTRVRRVGDAFAAADVRPAVRAAPGPVSVADEDAWWWQPLPDPVTGFLELLGLREPTSGWLAVLFPAVAAGDRSARSPEVTRWLRTVPDDQLVFVARRLVAALTSVAVDRDERTRLAGLLAPLRLRLRLHYETPRFSSGPCPPGPGRPTDYQRLLDALAAPGRLIRSGGVLDGFWSGLVAGDLDRVPFDSTAAEAGRAGGQTLASILLYGDVRDLLANLVEGRPGGTALAAAGLIPGLGDGAKAATAAGRVVRHADDAHDVARALPGGLTPADAAPLFRRLAVTDPPQPRTLQHHGIESARMVHFLRRHTYDHFEFTDKNIKAVNSIFPPGTSPQALAGLVDEALVKLARDSQVAPGSWDVVASGVDLRVSIADHGGRRTLVQFYPTSGQGVVSFTRDELRAMKDMP